VANYGDKHSWLLIPIGAIVLIAVIVGSELRSWLRRNKRRRVIEDRLCLYCGYDLRGSRERCPECGGQIGRAYIPSRPPEIITRLVRHELIRFGVLSSYVLWAIYYFEVASELPDYARRALILAFLCTVATALLITHTTIRLWGPLHRGIDVKAFIVRSECVWRFAPDEDDIVWIRNRLVGRVTVSYRVNGKDYQKVLRMKLDPICTARGYVMICVDSKNPNNAVVT